MLLSIEGLTVTAGAGLRPILRDVALRVAEGEVVGLVGESGSGKSTTARAVLRLLPPGVRASGSVLVDGAPVLDMSDAELRTLRRGSVAMIHQDPRSALNPVRRLGDFFAERGASPSRAVELLGQVGLSSPERRLRQYPHELSGGMLQRVMIAGALALSPRLLLADEPTSALDVTTQAEILALLRSLRAAEGLGLLFITHDLHLAAAYCDRVCVMYAGAIVESRPASALFADPRHPYTRGLLASAPALDSADPVQPIPGAPPSLADDHSGCPFAPRCAYAEPECSTWVPEPVPLPDGTATCRLVTSASPHRNYGEGFSRRKPRSASEKSSPSLGETRRTGAEESAG